MGYGEKIKNRAYVHVLAVISRRSHVSLSARLESHNRPLHEISHTKQKIENEIVK